MLVVAGVYLTQIWRCSGQWNNGSFAIVLLEIDEMRVVQLVRQAGSDKLTKVVCQDQLAMARSSLRQEGIEVSQKLRISEVVSYTNPLTL